MAAIAKPDAFIGTDFGISKTPFCVIIYPRTGGTDKGTVILDAFEQVEREFPNFLRCVVLRKGFKCFVVEQNPKNLPN